MRILIFSTVFAPSVGGIQNLVRMLATDLVTLGQEVIVVTDTPAEEPNCLPFRVIRQPSLREHIRVLRWCDVCHHHNISLKNLHPFLWRKKPLVVTHHGEYGRPNGHRGWQDLLKLRVSRLTVNICCSGFVARQLRKCVVIPNQYDSDTFEVLHQERSRELIFVGRLVSQKGCDTLLEALTILKQHGLRPGLTIVGDGEERARLMQVCADRELGQQVTFVGILGAPAIAEQLNRHKILVVPSLRAEGFGIVALEGLACGCLPIVSCHGGLTEAVGPHGLTFENGDAAELAARIGEALSGEGLISKKLRGVEAHLVQHERRHVARRYLDVYHEAARAAAV